jgi:hypothetical protein
VTITTKLTSICTRNLTTGHYSLFILEKRGRWPWPIQAGPIPGKLWALDSEVEEVIYEANYNYNSNIPEIVYAYTEWNKIAVPLLKKLIKIQKQ